MRTIKTFFEALGVIGVLAYVMLIVGALVGYLMNIWNVVQIFVSGGSLDSMKLTLSLVGQLVGLFVYPIGSLMGWLV